MLQVKAYSQCIESCEIIGNWIFEIEDAKDLWSALLQDGYFEKKEGVLTNGVYRVVFTYTGGFDPNFTPTLSLMERINKRGRL